MSKRAEEKAKAYIGEVPDEWQSMAFYNFMAGYLQAEKDTIERIQEEIERMKNENEVSDDKEYAIYELDVACGYDMAIKELNEFLDALEKE